MIMAVLLVLLLGDRGQSRLADVELHGGTGDGAGHGLPRSDTHAPVGVVTATFHAATHEDGFLERRANLGSRGAHNHALRQQVGQRE